MIKFIWNVDIFILHLDIWIIFKCSVSAGFIRNCSSMTKGGTALLLPSSHSTSDTLGVGIPISDLELKFGHPLWSPPTPQWGSLITTGWWKSWLSYSFDINLVGKEKDSSLLLGQAQSLAVFMTSLWWYCRALLHFFLWCLARVGWWLSTHFV